MCYACVTLSEGGREGLREGGSKRCCLFGVSVGDVGWRHVVGGCGMLGR